MKRSLGLLALMVSLHAPVGAAFAQWEVGPPPDRDFFTAGEDPERLRDLTLNDLYHTNRVVHSIKVGRYDEAIADLKFVLDKWPNHPRALLLIESLGKVTQAPTLPIPYYEKAIKLYPQYAMTLAQYGRYLVEIDQWDKGVQNLKRAIEKDQKMIAAHVWLAEAYDKRGDKQLARKEAEHARSLGFQGELPVNLELPPKSSKVK
jgi:Tfp pilus assembly protein PilF